MTSTAIADFINNCRTAQSDLESLNRELDGLKNILEQLTGDENLITELPDNVRRNLLTPVEGCRNALRNIDNLLQRLAGRGWTRTLIWVASSKREVEGLQKELGRHRNALSLGLQVTTTCVCWCSATMLPRFVV